MRGRIDPKSRGTHKVRAPASGRDVRDFPAFLLAAGSIVYRIHRSDFSTWWFSSDGSQRFDIPEPCGTCYVADRPIGAFLETLGRFSLVSEADVAVRRLATITLDVDLRLADCLSPAAAGFGVTATTSAGYPYSRESHPWALRFYQAGFDGVRYGAAHHPSMSETSHALFGESGENDGCGHYSDRMITDELLEIAHDEFGLRVL